YGYSSEWQISDSITAAWIGITSHTVLISAGEYKGLFIIAMGLYINSLFNRKTVYFILTTIIIICVLYGVELVIQHQLPTVVATELLANNAIDILVTALIAFTMSFVASFFVKRMV
ncbi:MAG: hypothetical protein QXL15_03230, partial [Candidatus Korarchaeota archaeon]